jgi:hypothetical protein
MHSSITTLDVVLVGIVLLVAVLAAAAAYLAYRWANAGRACLNELRTLVVDAPATETGGAASKFRPFRQFLESLPIDASTIQRSPTDTGRSSKGSG